MAVGPVIWMNGMPGVGKSTIAKAMRALDSSIVIIDNHSLIDPVEARLAPEGRKHPKYNEERKIERQKALRSWVVEPEHKHSTIVFTDFQSVDSLGSSVAREYEAAATEAGRPFLPVYLTCDEEQHLIRAMSDDRKHGGTTKLTDEAILKMILVGPAPFRFEGQGLEIDVTRREVDEVAAMILQESKKG